MNRLKRIILSFLFVFVCLFSVIINTEAMKIDLENIELKVEGITATDQTKAVIKIYESGFDEDEDYMAIITEDKSSIPDKLDDSSDSVTVTSTVLEDGTIIKNSQIYSTAYLKKAEMYGDVYITFYGYDTANWVKISDPILVEKPEDLKISKRIIVFPFHDTTSFFINNLSNISTERNLSYKIGKVTDETLINEVKSGSYEGLEQLLKFAKEDENNVIDGEVKATSSQPALYKQTDLTEGSYYYVYLELDDESGKYYFLEDVNLYQCVKTTDDYLWLKNLDESIYDSIDDAKEEQAQWDEFIEKFKTTDLINSVGYEDITIIPTEKSLKISVSEEGNIWTTKFTYEDGILTFVPSNDENTVLVDGIWISNTIFALAELKDYDYEEVLNWLEENENLTLDKNGIEYDIEENKIENENEFIDVSISTDKFLTFKLDIKNGLKTFTPSIEDKLEVEDAKTDVSKDGVENPKTGINLGYGILAFVILLSLSAYAIIRKKSKFPKHN